MSASRRAQRDKRLDNLKKESVKLNQDVEHMQDALLLHQRFQENEDSTVKGMIRKEVGGSIWQHGGSGKLRTYKSTRDLDDPFGIGTPKTKAKDTNGTKLTKKASDRNDTNDIKHSAPNGSSKPSNKSSSYKPVGNKLNSENNSNENNDMDRFKVKSSVRRDVSPEFEYSGNAKQGEDAESRTIGNYDWQKMDMLKTKVIKKASANVITRKKSAAKSKDNKISENRKVPTENVLSNALGRGKSTPVKSRRENSRERKRESIKVETLQKQSHTQQIKPPETPAPGNSLDLESDSNKKEPNKLTSPKFPKQTNRIFVGDQDSGSRSPSGTGSPATPKQNTDSQSVVTSEKHSPRCDPDVHLWLRRLGLLEEEKYVQIFAKNEIDMEELLLLSPEHLNKLGVVAVGAFNKIVRGIEELQQKPTRTDDKAMSIKSDKMWSHWETTTAGHCPSVSENDWDPSQESPLYGMSSTPWQNKSMQVPKNAGDGNKLLEVRSLHGQDFTSDKMSSHSSENNNFDNIMLFEHESHNEKFKSRDEVSVKKETKKLDINGNKRTLSRSNSFNSRSSTSKPPVKREQERTSKKDAEKNSDKKSNQGKLQPRPRSRSLSRRGSVSKNDQKTPTPSVTAKQKTGNQQDLANVVTVEASKQQRKPAVNAAARRLEEKQKLEKDSEEKEQKSRERRRQQRDELAAKHLSREKSRRAEDEEEEEDSMTHIQQWATDVTNHTLADLLTVSVLDTGSHTDEPDVTGLAVGPASVLKEEGTRPAYSRRAPKLSSRQSVAVPQSEVIKEDPNKFLVSSSLRISSRPPKHNTTKQVPSTAVRDLEQQIQSLQDRAMSGELITMDLVRDLQNRLVQVEAQVTNQDNFEQLSKSHGKNMSISVTKSNLENDIVARLNLGDNLSNLNVDERFRPEGETSLFEDTATLDLQSNGSDEDTEENFSLIKEQMQVRNAYQGNTRSSTVSMSMSKRALLTEIKKEKAQHRKQIRHLNSELNRIRQTEPARNIEVDPNDVQFDEQDLIGEGTFSRVYKGKYQGTEVAVKQLKIPLSSQDRNYFTAEVSLLRDLRHPRVVLLMGVCSTSRLPLMVLEYMARGSLYHRLHSNNREPLDHAEYFRISHDIALGMAYLHQQKPAVLHLDLKSMNVLICSNDRAKIADFGFSKLRYDANLKATKTSKSKPVQGCPAWMAPELLETGELTPKADVYSFGVILWEMLTRKQPYEGCSVFQVLERVRLNKRPEIPSNCPAELTKFIQQCWAPAPAKRLAFKEILAQLENMTFPSEWQDLFREAGVPPEALEDIHSARTIISLVTNSLDTANAKSLVEDMKLKRSFGTYVEPEDGSNTASLGPSSPKQSDYTTTSGEIRLSSSQRKSQDILNEVLKSRDISPRKINSSRSPREHLAQMNNMETSRKPVEPLVIPTGKECSPDTSKSFGSSRSSPDKKSTERSQSSPEIPRPLRSSQDTWSSPRGTWDRKGTVQNSIAAEAERSVRNSIAAEAERSVRNSIAAEAERSVRNSIAAEAERSVRNSIAAEAERSVRNSIAAEAERSMRNSIAAEGNKSVRNSIAAKGERSARNSIAAEGDKSVRNSIAAEGERSVRSSIAAEGERSVRNSIAAEGEKYNQNQTYIRQSLTGVASFPDVKYSNDGRSPRTQNNSPRLVSNSRSLDVSNNSVGSMNSRKDQTDLRKSLMSDIHNSSDILKKGKSPVDLRQNLLSEVRNSKNVLKKSAQTVTPISGSLENKCVRSSTRVTPRLQTGVKDFQSQVINSRNSLRKSVQGTSTSQASMADVDPRGAVIDEIKTEAPNPHQGKLSTNISRDSLNISQDIEIESLGSIDEDSLDSPKLRDSLEENLEANPRNVSRAATSPRPQMKPKPTGLKSTKKTSKSKLGQGNDKVRVGASTNWMTELSSKLHNLGNFSDQENSTDETAPGSKLSSQLNQQKRKSGGKIRGGDSASRNPPKSELNSTEPIHSKRDVSSPYKTYLPNGADAECISFPSPPPGFPAPPPPPPGVPAPPPPAPPPPPVLSVTEGKKQIVKPAIVSKDLPQASRATNRGPQCGVAQVGNTNNPSLMLKSTDLRDQKETLVSTSKPHPSQLHDLRHVKKSTMVSIAEILKKAVSSRRMALGEDPNSPTQSVASSWSLMDD